jgi:hypothetical protein
LADVFHLVKVHQQIERKDSVQAVCQRMRIADEADEAAKNFELILKIQNLNLKNLKLLAVNVLSWAYPMV